MAERSSIFDMIGPVMIGPSSSHTAGVARIGRMARKILEEEPEEATITFYNSFAATYEGHGSDRAVAAGLLDFAPDDARLRDALKIADERGIKLKFQAVNSAPRLHPNSIRIQSRKGGRFRETLGVSRGGGLITIEEIDGFHANISGQSTTLIILAEDAVGSIAYITMPIATDQANVATLVVTRRAKKHDAMLIFELDAEIRKETLDYLRSYPWVKYVTYIPETSFAAPQENE